MCLRVFSVSSSSSIPSKKTVISESVQMAAVPVALPNNCLAVISSISENKHKKIVDVLNSGSNFNLTDSVTISNQTLQFVVHTG